MNELLCLPTVGEAQGPADFLATLTAEAEAHVAVRHPWLAAFAKGDLPDPVHAVREFAVTYHGYSQWFPRYLQAVIRRLPDGSHRALLAENLAEERGQLDAGDRLALAEAGIDPDRVAGIPHSRLFRQFCHALGITDAELELPRPEAARWRERFFSLLQRGSAAFCVGALGLGTEGVVRPIYLQLLEGIRRAVPLRREDYVFFELHCLVDDQHHKDLLAISAELAATPAGRAGLRSGMRTALDLRAEFFDALHRRLLVRSEPA